MLLIMSAMVSRALITTVNITCAQLSIDSINQHVDKIIATH